MVRPLLLVAAVVAVVVVVLLLLLRQLVSGLDALGSAEYLYIGWCLVGCPDMPEFITRMQRVFGRLGTTCTYRGHGLDTELPPPPPATRPSIIFVNHIHRRPLLSVFNLAWVYAFLGERPIRVVCGTSDQYESQLMVPGIARMVNRNLEGHIRLDARIDRAARYTNLRDGIRGALSDGHHVLVYGDQGSACDSPSSIRTLFLTVINDNFQHVPKQLFHFHSERVPHLYRHRSVCTVFPMNDDIHVLHQDRNRMRRIDRESPGSVG